MSYGLIATCMFSSMMVLLLTGQRIFAVIGFVGAAAAVLLWGEGGVEMPFTAIIKVMNWYPLLTAAAVRLHGLHAGGIEHRRRPLQDVPRLVRAGARRPRDRHDRA